MFRKFSVVILSIRVDGRSNKSMSSHSIPQVPALATWEPKHFVSVLLRTTYVVLARTAIPRILDARKTPRVHVPK